MRLGHDYFDITPPISSRIGVFPGDVAFKRRASLDFEQGHHLRLSSIETTLHLGAHADGPNHYQADGQSIEQRDLDLYMGHCEVITAQVARGERVEIRHLARSAVQSTRVLLRTLSFPNPDQWNADFCGLSEELVDSFARQGVRLIGIDTPSVDLQDSKKLEAHARIAKHGMGVLEGIVLEHVPDGLYTLIALPLPIEAADASPVRAILLRDENLLFDLENRSR